MIRFGPNTKPTDVSPYSIGVLTDVMRVSGTLSLTISSTQRTPANQARVMFDNIKTHGAAAQHALYGQFGDAVIDVYSSAKAAGQTDDEIRAAMTAKIIELGPMNVSHHAADPKLLNVFDVGPSSVADIAAFERAAMSDKRVSRFLKPPSDPGLHFEIPQPQ